jgi:hypothetical protein
LGRRSFGAAPLGDLRRTRRLVQMAAAFRAGACSGGGGTISSVITQTHQAKAAYRLLDQSAVTHATVMAAPSAHVRTQIAQATGAGVTLLIEDTTAIAYPGLQQARGLGPIGEDYTRGFWLHNTLAVRWEPPPPEAQARSGGGGRDRCWPLGLAHQQAWARPAQRPARRKSNGRGKESNQARQLREDRESSRWGRVLQEPDAAAWLQGAVPVVYVADRESDIYEVFGHCQRAGVSFVIRAAHARALADPTAGPDLMTAAAQAPVRGQMEIDLPQREGNPVTLEMRATSLLLRGPVRPGGRLEDRTLGVLQVREIHPPAGGAALCWVLLTDLPLDTLEACVRVTRLYRCRWLIEELHKGIKTGLRLEFSQLSDYRRLSVLAAILSVVAVFLLQTQWSARTNGEAEIGVADADAVVLEILAATHPPPQGRRTRQWFWISLARLGGFMARKGDGHPGWLTLWRGWQTLQLIQRGYVLRGQRLRCGER